MNTIIAFIQNRASMLCDLYTKEYMANDKSAGVLAFTIRDGQMKVAYLLDEALAEINPEIYQELVTRRQSNTTDVIYFYGYIEPVENTNSEQVDNHKLFELDIRDFISGK
jgi:lambda repressor-like predicted transcriptional regulator